MFLICFNYNWMWMTPIMGRNSLCHYVKISPDAQSAFFSSVSRAFSSGNEGSLWSWPRLKTCVVILSLTRICLHGIVINKIQEQLDLFTIFVASCLVPEIQYQWISPKFQKCCQSLRWTERLPSQYTILILYLCSKQALYKVAYLAILLYE